MVPADGIPIAAILIRVITTLAADIAARCACLALRVPTVLRMLPSLMRAVQRIAFLGVDMARIAVRRRHILVLDITADQLVRIAVCRMLVFARMARLCLLIPAFPVMLRVMLI